MRLQDPIELLQRAVGIVRAGISCDVVKVLHQQCPPLAHVEGPDEMRRLHLVAHAGPDRTDLPDDTGADRGSFAAYVLEQDRSVAIADVHQQSDSVPRRIITSSGTRALLGCVLPGEAMPYGVLTAECHAVRHWSADEQQILDAMAMVLAGALKRIHHDQERSVDNERYRTLFEGVPIGILRLDATGRILDSNGAARALLGHGPDGATARWVPPRLRQIIERAGAPDPAKGGTLSSEMPLCDLSDEQAPKARWVRIRLRPALLQGRPVYEGSIEDVTAVHEEQRRRLESESRLKRVLEQSRLAVWQFDKDLCVTVSEGRGLRRIRGKPPLTVGQSIAPHLSERPDLLEDFERLRKGESFQAIRSWGETVWLVDYAAIRDAQGDFDGGLAVAVDHTELTANAVENERLVNELQERLKELSLLTTSISRLTMETEDPEHVFQEIASEIPSGLQWPERAVATIRWSQGGRQMSTASSGPHRGDTTAPLRVQAGCVAIEATYEAGGPERGDDPWLPEERVALQTLANMLDGSLERCVTMRRLKQLEQLHRATESMASIGSWSADIGAEKIIASDQLFAIYGLPVTDDNRIEPAAITALAPPEVAEYMRQAFEDHFVKGTRRFTIDHHFVRPDGQTRWLRTETIIQRDPQHRPLRVYGLTQDVTKEHQAARSLQESEHRLQNLVRAAPVLVAQVDAGHKIVTLDGGRLVGDLGGPPQSGCLDDLLGSASAEAVDRAIASGLPVSLLVQRNGRYLDCRIMPADGPNGTLDRVHIFALDVTQRRRAEQAEDQIQKLKELDEFRTRFIRTAAHELNTPMTPLSLQLDLLKSGRLGPLTSEQESGITLLERNLKRLQIFVQDMLDSVRLQAGHLRLRPLNTDLGQLMDELAGTYGQSAEQEQVTLELHERGDLRLHADPGRIMQILVNLVVNGIKFTAPGGHVRVYGERLADSIELRVEDTGAGIDPARIKDLFRPFVQVHDNAGPRGTGLGLYITHGIVEAHGGTIRCMSDGKGKGSTFVVRLPLHTTIRGSTLGDQTPDGTAMDPLSPSTDGRMETQILPTTTEHETTMG